MRFCLHDVRDVCVSVQVPLRPFPQITAGKSLSCFCFSSSISCTFHVFNFLLPFQVWAFYPYRLYPSGARRRKRACSNLPTSHWSRGGLEHHNSQRFLRGPVRAQEEAERNCPPARKSPWVKLNWHFYWPGSFKIEFVWFSSYYSYFGNFSYMRKWSLLYWCFYIVLHGHHLDLRVVEGDGWKSRGPRPFH